MTATATFARDPVLRTPYEPPEAHWRLNAQGRTTDVTDAGRRPSLPRIEAPSPTPPFLHAGETDAGSGFYSREPDVEPHRTINQLRGLVGRWRTRGWPGVSSPTRRLLKFWSEPPGGVPMRPFWCQLEAAETVIWLLEAGPQVAPGRCQSIRRRLRATNERWNEGVPRLALKLATGTGKTHLMAMLALWWTSRNEGPVHFLAIAPNLTVREGLEQALDPKNKHAAWGSLTPRGFKRLHRRMHWTAINFQKFQRRSGPPGVEDAGGKEKTFLTGGLDSPEDWEESPEDMLSRLLDKSHAANAKFLVINDEAHHCYAPPATPVKLDREEKKEQQAAALWFSALAALHRAGRLERVLDFSATPMWLKKPVELESEIFPWTISDFPLLDAMESGLVKIPRVPVADDTDSWEPRYRNIYRFAGGKDCRAGELQGEIREPLQQLYDHYEKRISPRYEEKGVLPIFIVVANKIANAERLHRWIAGAPREGGLGTQGQLPLLSNYGPDGRPKKRPPTVLVHSRLFEPEKLTGKLAKAIEEQTALHAPEAKTKDEKKDAIRQVFMTTGRKGEPGEHIRCVISVGMLTEGWDARNVTHIFGYRRFGSLLLCEQVTGRALRRTSFTGRDERQTPEYANVFGVPYTFARGQDADVPGPLVQPWRVHTVPGRTGRRIRFPRVVGYAAPERIRRWRLNRAKVGARVVALPPTPKETEGEGPIGPPVIIKRPDQEETDRWRAAALLATKLDPQRASRRTAFQDALPAIREWLTLPGIRCPDVAGLEYDDAALRSIARACEAEGQEGRWRPVFADERDPGESRVGDTSEVDFETSLRLRWPRDPLQHRAVRSELNAAACHSSDEVTVAAVLDRHPRIEAWARNFRLGWEAPWFDEHLDGWRRTEPDFVARVAGNDLHLLIEFKGMKAGEAGEEAKRLWLERWCEVVTEQGEHGRWRLVWIENSEFASDRITKAISDVERG